MTHGSLSCEGQIVFRKHLSSDDEFLSVIENNLPVATNGMPTHGAHEEPGVPIEFEGMITVGLAMRPVIRRIVDDAAVDIPVLITGETGTGKDLVLPRFIARALVERGLTSRLTWEQWPLS